MPRTQLNLSNLHELDQGKAALAVNHALRQVVLDVLDRPADKAKRKVQLTVFATPVLDQDTGVLENVDVQFKIKTLIPDRQTVEYPMKPTKDGILYFQSLDPQNPDQADFADLQPGKTKVATTDESDESEVAEI